MKQISDLPAATLAAVIEALEQKIPPAEVRQVSDLFGQDAMLRLAFNAGRRSVVQDFHNAINRQQDEVVGGRA
jgi:hypothetical protein